MRVTVGVRMRVCVKVRVRVRARVRVRVRVRVRMRVRVRVTRGRTNGLCDPRAGGPVGQDGGPCEVKREVAERAIVEFVRDGSSPCHATDDVGARALCIYK